MDTNEFNWVTVKDLPGSEIELTGELPAEQFAGYRTRALAKLQETAQLPGFRKGHVPEDILVKTIGESAVLEEAAEIALGELYPRIVLSKGLDVVGRPQIGITKLAKDNPLGFRAVTAVMPTIGLPEYKKIATQTLKQFADETTDVSNEEFEEFLKSIRTQFAAAEKAQAVQADPNTPVPETAELPELTDEMIKKLGAFENLEDFKTKARTHLKDEKGRKLKEKRRLAITDAIIVETTLDLPAIFVESELEKMTAQFGSDIERMGMKLEDYLKSVKKSIEDLRTEWKVEAEKRAKLQLVLNEIAEKESIKADPEEVKREADHVMEHFKDADRERLHIYVESMLKNDAVLRFLEGEK